MSINTGSGSNFVKRIYPPRVFGSALAFSAVAVVLYQQQAPWHFWVFIVFNAFLWPHLAYFLASNSEEPTLAEYRNLIIDAVVVGIWIPLLAFSLLPALVLLTTVGLSSMTVGGWRFFLKSVGAVLVGLLLGWQWALFTWGGFGIRPEPNMLILIGSAPLMVVFPLSIGMINFSLSRRLAGQREALEKISRTDALSQLSNRRYWEESVFREWERHKRSGSPLSLIMIDIDHFKRVNDEYGHVAGDQVIREISNLFAEAVRQSDVVGRYGGEEFGLLLPDTEIKGALQFAERLRLAVQTLIFKPYGFHCTISLGVAEVDSDVKKHSQLIENADKALYVAKRQGRNIALAYDPA
jgi:diguanylate cyclase